MKIFFDVDGVLIRGWHVNPAYRRPWDLHLERDLGIKREALAKALFLPSSDGADPPMADCALGRADLKEVLAALLPDLGYKGSVDRFLEYWFTKDSDLNRDVMAVVGQLAAIEGVELYLATGQEHHRARYLWHDLDLKHHFTEVFFTAQLGLHKHDPAFFQEINKRLEMAEGEQPLFFDDAPPVVAAARAAGWDAHVFETVSDITSSPRLQEVLT
ncbi:MAG: HAD-IA family hydrolase [Pseudomonadota bacterium]